MNINIVFPEAIVERNSLAYDAFLSIENFESDDSINTAIDELLDSVMGEELLPEVAEIYLNNLAYSIPHVCYVVGFGLSLAFQNKTKPLNYLFNRDVKQKYKMRDQIIGELREQFCEKSKPISPHLAVKVEERIRDVADCRRIRLKTDMSYKEAVEILEKDCCIVSDTKLETSLQSSSNFIEYCKKSDQEPYNSFESIRGKVHLEGHFSAEQLQALAVWAKYNIENKG